MGMRLTDEERNLIDTAIAEGRIRRIPLGVSVLAPQYRWDGHRLISLVNETGKWIRKRPGRVATLRRRYSALMRLNQKSEPAGNRSESHAPMNRDKK